MNLKQSFLLVAITTCFVTKSFSQHRNYHITNGVGVFGGITKFNILTDNLTTKQGSGFLGGLSATVDIPHRWYNMSFGMQLSESPVGIAARTTENGSDEIFIDYKLFAAQIALLGHIKLGTPYVTIDLGPMLQYNSKLELKDKNQAGYYINTYDRVLASDLNNITRFNVNGLIGASAGYGFFRLKAEYIYGFTNMLSKLNSENIDASGGISSFKGNQSMLVLGALFMF
ncbi:hypothetical protein [Gaetbulibacter saemankumensis]|uniref:hypothetical protein n=1 Tax=Gaetbulibacter saemankumensis TaxID=311208 RepID=UPI00041ED53A|nr:hypothetical protein [Gaetbulibacter saemankumensis]